MQTVSRVPAKKSHFETPTSYLYPSQVNVAPPHGSRPEGRERIEPNIVGHRRGAKVSLMASMCP